MAVLSMSESCADWKTKGIDTCGRTNRGNVRLVRQIVTHGLCLLCKVNALRLENGHSRRRAR